MHNYKLTRRDFLKASGASLFLSGIPLPGFTKDNPPGNISVIILEGGMDGLTAVPPFGDPNLEKMRSSLIPEDYLKLNSFFGLHPSLKKLTLIFQIDFKLVLGNGLLINISYKSKLFVIRN